MSPLDGDFQGDWDFQARFSEHQREIAQKAVRVEFAPIEDDLKRNTDLILRSVVPIRDRIIRISARVRRRKHLSRYQNQFTIRYRRPSGVATEIDKMRLGDGDLFIYGFESQPCVDHECGHEAGKCRLDPWLIGDLHILRDYDAAGGFCEIRTNKGQHGSHLAAFYLADMPLGFVRDSEHIPALDRGSPWAECRNPHWPRKGETWKAGQRVGMCGGAYVTAMVDPETSGTGYWRKCLCCGFTWRAGWEMPWRPSSAAGRTA